jgi:hypothetical protein
MSADAPADCPNEKTCKCRPFLKRLKGFEPSTFCMGKQLLSRPDRLEMPANQRIRGQDAGDGIPGIAARSQGFRQGNDNEAVVAICRPRHRSPSDRVPLETLADLSAAARAGARPFRARRGQVARPAPPQQQAASANSEPCKRLRLVHSRSRPSLSESAEFTRKRKPLRRRLAGHGRLGWGSDKGRRQLIEARERARESRTGRGSDPEPVDSAAP